MTTTPFITRWQTSAAAEETTGVIRWLRPEYQAPSAETRNSVSQRNRVSKGGNQVSESPWPERLAEQAQAVRTALAALDGPATVEQVAAAFVDAPPERVAELLETLASLGQVAVTDGQETRFVVAA